MFYVNSTFGTVAEYSFVKQSFNIPPPRKNTIIYNTNLMLLLARTTANFLVNFAIYST